MTQPKQRYRWLKGLGCAVLVLFAIFATFLLIEKGRGSWAWKRRLTELAQRGERLKVSELEPARAEPARDSAAALLAFTNRLSEGLSNFYSTIPPYGRFAEPGRLIVASKLTNWSSDKKTNAWPDVHALLTADSRLTNDVHDALKKGGWNDACNYQNGFIDFNVTASLMLAKSLSQYLTVSALAALQQGDIDTAITRVEDSARLIGLQANSPIVINQLVRVACANIAWNATWEIMTSEQCTETRLARLQAAWENLNFGADMARAFEMERAMTLAQYDLMAGSSEKRAKAVTDMEDAAEFGMGTQVPTRGWVLRKIHIPIWRFAWAQQDELRSLNRWQEVIEFDRRARSNSWAAAATPAMAGDDELSLLASVFNDSASVKLNAYDRCRYMFSGMSFGVGPTVTKKAMQMETLCHLMVTAIALQRYHLRQGKFPERLEELVPDFIREVPADLMSGKNLCYRLNADGSPLLYSTGEDGKDEGGDSSLRSGVSEYRNVWQGKDAVWPGPASAEAAGRAANEK